MSPIVQSNATPPEGMPIYEDSRVRSIVDSLDEDSESQDWFPGNGMAIKLWQCLEALRDIDVALENAVAQKNATKRKRQLKQFSVQLHSFASAVVRLCDQVVGDADARKWLEPSVTKQVSAIKAEFLDLVPIDHKGDLSVIRNRMGGHVDRDLSPWTAHEILSRRAISSFGKWLHVCLHALLDLLKLEVYAWTVRSHAESCIRIMANEPYLLTILVEEEEKQIVALHLSKRSPRNVIADIVDKVVRDSQWMFERGDPRIGKLKVDDANQWNTFAGCSALWQGEPVIIT